MKNQYIHQYTQLAKAAYANFWNQETESLKTGNEIKKTPITSAIENLNLIRLIPSGIGKSAVGYGSEQMTNSALPTWLNYNPVTDLLTGTAIEMYNIDLSMKNTEINLTGANVTTNFNPSIETLPNNAPTAEGVLDNQTGEINEWWQFELPNGSFTDIDLGDRLRYSLRMADGSAVPAWLTIDYMTGNVAGIPDSAGILNLLIVATDLSGAEAIHQLEVEFKPDVAGSEIIGTEWGDYLFGTAENDVIYGGEGDDYISGIGSEGDDYFSGGNGDDYIDGSGSGHKILDGGAGNDTLIGGADLNSYIFGTDSGQDIIYDYNHSDQKRDIIELTADVDVNNIQLNRSGNDLIISIIGTTDSLTISNYFSYEGNPTYNALEIQFDGGAVWDMAQIDAHLNRAGTDGNDALYGTNGNDEIHGGIGYDQIFGKDGDDMLYGGQDYDLISGGEGNDFIFGEDGFDSLSGDNGNDMLDGGEGDDMLFGGEGDDVLIGGKGIDHLNGGSGSNTYVFARGDGNDIISNYEYTNIQQDIINLGEGIEEADLIVRRVNNTLVIAIADTTDSITIDDYFQQSNNGINRESVHFVNGTIWDMAKIIELTSIPTEGDDSLYGDTQDNSLYGNAGDDTLIGAEGNDILDGGAGNDVLIGGEGSDTYIFGRGYGQDMIDNFDFGSNKKDIIRFASDILATDVEVSRNENSLILTIKGTTDELSIFGYFDFDFYKIEEIQFNDGTIWDNTAIMAFTSDGANLLAAQSEIGAAMALNQVMSPASYLMADELFDNTAPTLGLSSNSLTTNTETQADIAKEVQSLINAMASFGTTEGSMTIEDQTYGVLTPITVPN